MCGDDEDFDDDSYGYADDTPEYGDFYDEDGHQEYELQQLEYLRSSKLAIHVPLFSP